MKALSCEQAALLLSHPGVGNDTLAALKGKPILIGAAGRTSFWLWLKAKYGYGDEQIRHVCCWAHARRKFVAAAEAGFSLVEFPRVTAYLEAARSRQA